MTPIFRSPDASDGPACPTGLRARRALLWVLPAFTVLLLGGGKAARADVMPTHAALREFCNRLVSSGDAVLQPFTILEEDGTVTYYGGDVVVVSEGGGVCDDPLGVLVRAQSRIELVRRYVQAEDEAGRPQARSLLGGAIEEAEGLVGAGLERLRATRHSQEVRLRRTYMVLWRVSEVFLSRVWAWADEKGHVLQTLCEKQGTCLDPCGSPNVPLARVVTSPPEATISYIPAFDWDLSTLRKIDPIPAMRQAMRSPLEVLAGHYVLKVEWADGTVTGPQRVEVKGTLELKRP